METQTINKQLIERLHEIILAFMRTVPSEIMEKVGDLWFVFDENSLMYSKDGLCAFATHESTVNTITFYLTMIRREKFDDQRLYELVVHEFSHAVGFNEEQVAELMQRRIKRLAK